jgi:hypothetical protein
MTDGPGPTTDSAFRHTSRLGRTNLKLFDSFVVLADRRLELLLGEQDLFLMVCDGLVVIAMDRHDADQRVDSWHGAMLRSVGSMCQRADSTLQV